MAILYSPAKQIFYIDREPFGLSAFISKSEKSIDELNFMALQAVTCVYYRHQTGERTEPDVQLSFANGEAFLSKGGEMY